MRRMSTCRALRWSRGRRWLSPSPLRLCASGLLHFERDPLGGRALERAQALVGHADAPVARVLQGLLELEGLGGVRHAGVDLLPLALALVLPLDLDLAADRERQGALELARER